MHVCFVILTARLQRHAQISPCSLTIGYFCANAQPSSAQRASQGSACTCREARPTCPDNATAIKRPNAHECTRKNLKYCIGTHVEWMQILLQWMHPSWPITSSLEVLELPHARPLWLPHLCTSMSVSMHASTLLLCSLSSCAQTSPGGTTGMEVSDSSTKRMLAGSRRAVASSRRDACSRRITVATSNKQSSGQSVCVCWVT